jgi:hypothetical protein
MAELDRKQIAADWASRGCSCDLWTDPPGLDVIATAWGPSGKVVWFQNPGKEGPWTMRVLKEKWPNANQVIAADFNKDGRIDLAATAERGSNELRWWTNLGRGK